MMKLNIKYVFLGAILFVVSGCAFPVNEEYYYESDWLKINIAYSSPGYQRLNEEIALNEPMKKFIEEKGIPNYIRVMGIDLSISSQTVLLAYIDDGNVYEFGRGSNVGLKKTMNYSWLAIHYSWYFPSYMIEEFRKHDKNFNSVLASASYCSKRKTCTEVNSCEEAMYLFLECGHKELDENKNGLACERTVCKGGWTKKSNAKELSNASTSSPKSNCHWVNGYTKKDGTRVRGHQRCR